MGSGEKHNLAERLRDHVVIFDGAMGTEIYKRHFYLNVSFEGLCLTAPKVIGEIHRSYSEAGAEVLTTNSYGANRNLLTKFGLGDKVKEINIAAVRLARENGDAKTLVAGSVGSVGESPVGKILSLEEKVKFLQEQIAALEEGGADFIMFETISAAGDVQAAIRAMDAGSGRLPYILSFKVDRNGESAKGEPLTQLLLPLNKAVTKPIALGLNCGEGAESTLASLEKLVGLVDYPLVVQPNSGIPKNVDGRILFMTSPEYLTTYALRYVQLGARGVGGCCGTGPEHIKDMVRSIRPLAAAATAEGRTVTISMPPAESLKPAVPTREKSALGAKLADGIWVTTVEIVPPHGYELKGVLEKAAQCKAVGVDAINIPDGPRASSRISPIVTAHQIQEAVGIETVLHFCCRDKNLIGMQADLLGCAALGIHNILFITGDPPKLGDYPFASAVFDVDSIGMVKIQHKLNRGADLGGKPIDPPTETLIAVGADPSAIDMKRELARTRQKVEAGAEFIITQPVFAVEPLLVFLEKIQDLRVPVIAGIWPLASLRNAEFMKNEVPGVVVPDETMRRMAKGKNKEEQLQEGISIARECIAKIRSVVQGVQVSAPYGNVGTALAVLKG